MDPLLALGLATAILVLVPGPNVALIVATSLQRGFLAGGLAVFGTTAGVAVQLAFVVLGLASLVALVAGALTWLKWLGVAYLLYLGIRAWRSEPVALDSEAGRPILFWRGFLIAAVNPKTLMFNAAFLPQFIPSGAPASAWAVSATVFLLVLLLGDLLWAAFAHSARPLLARVSGLQNRLSGAFLVLAAAGLAAVRRANS